MRETLVTLITLAGAAQLGVLIASALVPSQLGWRRELDKLPRLHRQMYWVYAGYIVLSITAFGLISLFNAREMAQGGALARWVCGYIALFWGVRLVLQGILDVKERLTARWLRLGYHLLTLIFTGLAVVYGCAALLP